MYLNYEEIGCNIRRSRKLSKMTQAQLAKAIGKPEQYISHIERARTKPSIEVLMEISSVLSSNLYLLLGENNRREIYSTPTLEIVAILNKLPPEQQKLCINLCRTVAQIPTPPNPHE